MDLTEARRILNANGYSLVKEMYDPPVDPPEGPDTEHWDDECEQEANEQTDIAAESIEEGLKEKYPDIAVSNYDVREDANSTDYYEGRDEWSYSKEFTCIVQIEIPPEAIGLSEETVKGELYPTKLYSFSEEAEQKMNELWAEAAEVNNSDIDFTDEYDSYYDPSYNMCVLQKSGTYKASQGNSRY